jgi:hypothetical protein
MKTTESAMWMNCMRQTSKYRNIEGNIPTGGGKFKPDKPPGRDGRRRSRISGYHGGVLSTKQET